MGTVTKKEKSYQKIIKEINSNLTDNKEENIKYLKEQTELYNTHSKAYEIFKEIGKLFTENLDEETLNGLNNSIGIEIANCFNKGINHLRERRLDEAEEELSEFINVSKIMFKDEEIGKYFTTKNPIEDKLILNDKKGKKIEKIGPNFSMGYTYLGFICVEKKDFEKAREYLTMALKWNPYNADAIFEYNEIYNMEGNLEEYKNQTIESLDKLYNPLDMARFYRNLGYYYIEKRNWQLAKAIYIYSMNFGDDSKAKEQIIYIIQKTNSRDVPNPKDIKSILEKNGIPVKITDKNLQILSKMLKQTKKEDNEDLKEYLKVVVNFYNSL